MLLATLREKESKLITNLKIKKEVLRGFPFLFYSLFIYLKQIVNLLFANFQISSFIAEKNVIEMNTPLAKVDHSQTVFDKEMTAYAVLFKNKRGMFRGERKTYAPMEGCPEDPTKRGTTAVQSIVNARFSVEAADSVGVKRVPLVVDGVKLGDLTALKEVNDVEAVPDNLDVKAMLNFIHKGA